MDDAVEIADVEQLVRQWPAANVALVATTADGVVWASGDLDRRFPLASVTKPLVATAVLLAVEEGALALDQPAGPPGSTIRHLLAHASGLSPDSDAVLAAPGTRRIYSNRGIEVAADCLAAATGISIADYLTEGVTAPLGMHRTSLPGSPASGAVSTAADLASWVRSMLRPSVLAAETVVAATREQFVGLAGVLPGFGRQDPNPWGLGFELRGHKAPHWTGTDNSPATFGHFGQSGTFVWVDPDAGLGLVGLGDVTFDQWAVDLWPRLSDAVLALR